MLHLDSPLKSKESQRREGQRRSAELELPKSVKCCDRTLVLRAQSGERGAFNALVCKYRQRIMNLSMRYTKNLADAEDAVQNTFLKAYCGLQSFRGDAAFYSWLHRIAINSAKTLISIRGREAILFSSELRCNDGAPGNLGMPADLDTPEELALTEEICDAVNTAIEGLGEEQREAIVLREFGGLRYSQVAAAMSCPVGTVRSRVFRAREAIDSRLRDLFDDGLSRVRRAPASRSRPTRKECCLS
jgi:RNA polymerase sigma-70 factor (ECF subfamily)